MTIRIDDLFYIYESNGATLVALRGLHLTVNDGECLVIKGPNGSGKSTLVQILTGFYKPSAGKILLDDVDITTIDPLRLRREFVASIDQRGNLLNDLTILQNTALGFALTGHTLDSSNKEALDLLERHGLDSLANYYPAELSAGERQFASLLAAMATHPEILIADEPSGELDNASAARMYQLLKSLAGESIVILVTHDARAEAIADRVVRIRDGRISEQWLPGADEESVIDPFGWMRVREKAPIEVGGVSRRDETDETVLLRAKDLALSYAAKELFSNISLTAHAGELITIASGSGSGKSSLLRILAGIQDPTKGEVEITGESLGPLDRSERAALRSKSISFLGQAENRISNVTLGDYLNAVLGSFDSSLIARASRPLSTFSGGERARIELLKVLSEKRPIILLDEPTSQMDEARSVEAMNLILDQVNEGALVIACTREPALMKWATQKIDL